MSESLSNAIQKMYYQKKNEKENVQPAAAKTSANPEEKELELSSTAGDANSDTVISEGEKIGINGDDSECDIEKELDEAREREDRRSQQQYNNLIRGTGRPKTREEEIEDLEDTRGMDENEDGDKDKDDEEEEEEEGKEYEERGDGVDRGLEDFLNDVFDESLQVRSNVVDDLPANKSIEAPLMGSTPKHKNTQAPMRGMEQYEWEDEGGMQMSIESGEYDEGTRDTSSIYPRKRACDSSSGKPKKRSKKIVLDDDPNLEKMDEERQRNIDASLKNAAAVIDIQSSFVRIALLNKVSVHRDQQAVDDFYNDALHASNLEYRKTVEELGQARGMGAARKVDKEVIKANEEVANRKRASINSVPEILRLHRTDDIRWPDSTELPTEREVLQCSADIVQGRLDVMNLYVRGRMIEDGNRSILWITDDVVKVLALRRLEARLNTLHPGKYLLPDEDNEVFLPKGTCSQPPPNSNHTETAATSFSQTADSKKTNPYGRIFCMVLEKNNCTIPDQDISLIKTLVKPREKEKSAMRKCQDIVSSVRILMEHHTTQKEIKEQLDKMNIACPLDCLKVAVLETSKFNDLMDAMKKFPEINNMRFCGKYAAARKINDVTADRVIRDLLNGSMGTEAALTTLEDHGKGVAFILMGKLVAKEVAEDVEARLEDNKITVQRLKHHTALKHRLEPKNLMKIRNEAKLILMELERDLNPCIAFTRAYVEERPTNSGGKGSKERCLVNFISMEDLTKNKDVFTSIASSRKRNTFFFVTRAESAAVEDLLRGEHSGIGGVELYVDCERFIDSSTVARTPTDCLTCVVIGASMMTAWSSRHLKQELAKYEIFNSVNNGQMRQLIYNVHKADDTVREVDRYNSVFAHSATQEIIAIIAKFAPNRVFTSADNIEDFSKRLRLAQKSTTRDGTTFGGIKIIKKPKPAVTDD